MDKLHDFRPAWLEVDLDNLIYNTRLFKEIIGEDVKLIATIKGNLYGAGVEHTARIIQENGADEFAVATLSEAIELRKFGITKPILILGYTPHNQYKYLFEYDITPNIYDLEDAKSLSEVAESLGKKKKIHVKLDTGMTRVGLDCSDESVDKVCEIAKLPGLELEGLFTHFSTADQPDDTYWNLQKERFMEVLKKLPELPRYVHVSNSATALWHDETIGNMIRYGVAMYGLNPSGHALPEVYPLQPALELVSELIQVKKLPAGEGIGYGETYITPEAEWIGTIPIGYADGWLRKMQGFLYTPCG